MSSIKSQRKSGQRRDPKHGGKSLLAPTLGVHTSDLGERRLNITQMHALDQMYSSHPAVQAARSVLHSQLLSGGVQLVRDGEPLKQVKFGEKGDDGKAKNGITKDFQQHLEEHWIPFARDTVDSFLKWGLVPVVFEAIEEDTHAMAMAALKRELGAPAGGKRKAVDKPTVLVPHVPHLGTCVSFLEHKSNRLRPRAHPTPVVLAGTTSRGQRQAASRTPARTSSTPTRRATPRASTRAPW